ncbi:MAG TPA: hypothetical protein VHN81_10240, partial [Edaphobacter sp.]|nr:hypothetical protein [Edaphobacter sp.]
MPRLGDKTTAGEGMRSCRSLVAPRWFSLDTTRCGALLLLIILLGICLPAAHSQTTVEGVVEGTVVDPANAAIAAADVTLEDSARA